jgi:hypothetical protein
MSPRLLLLVAVAISLATAACEPAGPSTPSAATQPLVTPSPTAPSTSAASSPTPLDAGVVPPSAEATVREQIHPGAKRCYQHGLEVDPAQAGRLVIALQVDSSGRVADASVALNDGLSAQVADCIAGVIRNARFAAPGADAKLSIPFNFVRLAPRAEDAGR